jgi:hypothetical protein
MLVDAAFLFFFNLKPVLMTYGHKPCMYCTVSQTSVLCTLYVSLQCRSDNKQDCFVCIVQSPELLFSVYCMFHCSAEVKINKTVLFCMHCFSGRDIRLSQARIHTFLLCLYTFPFSIYVVSGSKASISGLFGFLTKALQLA